MTVFDNVKELKGWVAGVIGFDATATAYMCVAVDTVTPAYTWKQITA